MARRLGEQPLTAAEKCKRYRENSREKWLAAKRKYNKANAERLLEESRVRHIQNRESELARARQYRAAIGELHRSRRRWWSHGFDVDEWIIRQWELQDGLCYLHGGPLDPKNFHIDHDHSCCPPSRSCQWCRRGLACPRCNKGLGHFGDDLDNMIQIVENYIPVFLATRDRIATKPSQGDLFDAAG